MYGAFTEWRTLEDPSLWTKDNVDELLMIVNRLLDMGDKQFKLVAQHFGEKRFTRDFVKGYQEALEEFKKGI